MLETSVSVHSSKHIYNFVRTRGVRAAQRHSDGREEKRCSLNAANAIHDWNRNQKALKMAVTQ